MARKKAETVVDQGDAAEEPVNGKPKPPVFKCGPIMTRKGESVQGCVWAKEFLTPDGRSYLVHSIDIRADYFSEKDGAWKPSSGFKPSQLSALEYILRRCGDYCYSQRDVQQKAEGEI